MRAERTDYERLTDDALLLCLWDRAQQVSGQEAVGDKLKAMKLAFLAAYPMFRDRLKGLNLGFYRYKWGPYTEQIDDNLADLKTGGLLGEDELYFVTDRGHSFVDEFTRDVLGLEENRPILSALEQAAESAGALSTDRILDLVYDMRCYTIESPARKQQVRAVEWYRRFTRILDDDEADAALYVPPGWEMTLELTLDPAALRNLQRGVEEINAGNWRIWTPTGSAV